MSAPRFLVSFEGERWRVARVSGSAVDVAEIAPEDGLPAVATKLRAWDWKGAGVALGLPSDAVLAALIDGAGLPRKGRDEAARYRLEEQLPVDAERLTADFMPASGSRLFGLAVDTLRVREVLSRLSAEGITVATISATALMALKDVSARAGSGVDFVLVAGTLGLDLFRLVEGRPEAWNSLAGGAEDILQALRANLLAEPVEGRRAALAVLGSPDPAIAAALAREGAVEVRHVNGTPAETSARGAAALLADDSEGWADFRRDGLAPAGVWGESPALARAAATLAVALPLVLAGTFLWRASEYGLAARDFEAQQLGEYIRAFPNSPVPTSVASRLRSEAARLTAIHGADARMPEQRSALDGLRRVVAALPSGLVKVTELRVGPTEIGLDGETKSHADAEQIARSLRSAGFDAEPPRSETDARGLVTFSITAKVTPGAAPKSLASAGEKAE